MGKALQLVSGFNTNAGATITAVAALSGESLTVPAFTPGTVALLGPIWAAGATAGVARIRSPRFHDNAQGIRLQHAAGSNEPLSPFQALQPIFPADLLTVELSGGGAETDMLAYLQHFDDLPGVQANLASWSDIQSRIKNVLGLEIDVTSGGVGAYGTPRAFNFSFDTLKASTLYALLGYTCSVKTSVVCFFGPDTGNQHIGGPGVIVSMDDTRQWFVNLAQETGRACIPIIQSNNRGATFLQTADVTNALATNVSVFLAELG